MADAERARRVEPRCILIHAAHDQRARTIDARHLGGEQSDGAGAENDDRIAGPDATADGDRIVADAARLGQRGALERQRIGNVMQATFGHAHEFGHRAVRAIAEARTLRAKVIFARAAVQAVAADRSRRLRNDPVAFFEPAHATACPRHMAAELVAEHDGDLDRPALLVVVLMYVAAADADGP